MSTYTSSRRRTLRGLLTLALAAGLTGALVGWSDTGSPAAGAVTRQHDWAGAPTRGQLADAARTAADTVAAWLD